AEHHEALRVVARAESIFSAEDGEDEEGPTLERELRRRRRFVEGYAVLRERTPERLEALEARIRRYEEELRQAGIEDPRDLSPANVSRHAGAGHLFTRSLLFVLLLPFADGLRALHGALGSALPEGFERKAAAAEAALGPDLAARLGALMGAQARYQTEIAPHSALVERAAAARAAAEEVLRKDGLLTSEEMDVLEEDVAATRELREAVGGDAGAVLLGAIQALSAPRTMSHDAPVAGLPETEDDFVYRDPIVIVMGDGDTVVPESAWPQAPVLFVDLGGNDTYRVPLGAIALDGVNPQVALDAAGTRTAVALELGGNDTYVSNASFSYGAARGEGRSPTLGAFLDAAGSDNYTVTDRTLGWGVDGFGVFVDNDGEDRYRATGSGIAGAQSTAQVAFAMGAFVERFGDDRYHTPRGMGRMESPGVDADGNDRVASQATVVGFFELRGSDTYVGDCEYDPDIECFGLPEGGPQAQDDRVAGALVFYEDSGRDKWPGMRGTRWGGFQTGAGAQGGPGSNGQPLATQTDSGAYVRMATHGFLGQDTDGDYLYDSIEQQGGITDPKRRQDLVALTTIDSDGDGYTDLVESRFRTNASNPDSYPVGVPILPAPLPDPGSAVGGPRFTRGRTGLLVDMPSPGIAIGLPGPSRYESRVLVAIDLGLDDGSIGANDFYFAPVAGDGLAIDLAGDDRYTAARRALGYSNGSTSAGLLLDAAGDDRYVSRALSMGYSDGGGRARLVDLDGVDEYRSPTMGYAKDTNAGVALLLDVRGVDRYERAFVTTLPSMDDAWAGRIGVPGTALTSYGAPTVAAFVDLQGEDAYRVIRPDGTPADISSARNAYLRAGQDGTGDAGVFMDLPGPTAQQPLPQDSDDDEASDYQEMAAGTQSHGGDIENPAEFALRVPRLGLAVGAPAATSWILDYAVAIDQGGPDVYRNHAGASGIDYATSVLLDSGIEDDSYVYEGAGTNVTLMAGAATSGLANVGESAMVAGAQGAGIFGIGVLVDSGGANEFRARVSHDARCLYCEAGRARALTLAQGVGFFGVGILRVVDGAGSTFYAEANATSDLIPASGPGAALAISVAQGAGLAGVGILDARGGTLDTYDVVSTALGDRAEAYGYAQGFGLDGVGVLIDDGGDNRLTGTTHTQGAVTHRTEIDPRTQGERSEGIGALILGPGNDELVARNASQAFADRTGLALLYDEAGDDRRVLRPPPGLSSWGQAAATTNGVALLLDARGNDVYESFADGAPDRAQGFLAGVGSALFVDLAGRDYYRATSHAQGAIGIGTGGLPSVANNERFPVTYGTMAFFLDRMGEDIYQLGVRRGVGWADLPPNPPGGTNVGATVFLDLGGNDVYPSLITSPASSAVVALDGRTADGDGDLNDWAWTMAESRGATVVGIDNDTISETFRAILGNVAAEGGVQIDASGPDVSGDVLAGVVNVSVAFSLAKAGVLKGSEGAINRTELLLDSAILGVAEQVDNAFTYKWTTSKLGADGLPAYPDGWHMLEALVYPVSPVTDVEPAHGNRIIAIDNAPVTRPPVATYVRDGWLHALLRVDRDLDTEVCVVCPGSFPTNKGPLAGAANEWAVQPSQDPFGVVPPDSTCPDACRPRVTARSGEGRAYLEWKAIASPVAPPLLGFRVERADNAPNFNDFKQIGYVDARAGPTWRFVDESPNASTVKYRVSLVRDTPNGPRLVLGEPTTFTLAQGPGPASGLRALGAEDGVLLAWNAAAGATGYEIERKQGAITTFITPPALAIDAGRVAYVDQPIDDIPATYRVVPKRGTVSGAATDHATAMASPGLKVTLNVTSVGEEPVKFTVLDGLPLGGNFTHDVAWRIPATMGDGQWRIFTSYEDARGKRSGEIDSDLVIDRTPPAVQMHVHGFLGGKLASSGGINVPFCVEEIGPGRSGVAWATLWASTDDGLSWRRFDVSAAQMTTRPDGEAAKRDECPLKHGGVVTVPGVGHGSRLRLFLTAGDHAGNVAGVVRPRAWAPDAIDARDDAIHFGRVVERQIDLVPPTGPAGDLDREVRPGDAVEIAVDVTDVGSHIETATLAIGEKEIGLAHLGGARYGTVWTAEGRGNYTVDARFEDGARNVGTIRVGRLVVDPEAPVVRSAAALFSGGRTVGKAGELVTLRIDVVDNLTRSGALLVDADLSNVSTRESVRLPWEGIGTAYSATFLADRLGATNTSNATVVVRDPAGNAIRLQVPVRVDARPANVTLPEVDVLGPDAANLIFAVEDGAGARVDYGASVQLGARADAAPFGGYRLAALRGLAPDTEYLARAVSVSAAGVESVSDIVRFRTLPAILVTIDEAPRYARAAFDVAASAARYDGKPFSADVQA
ncbi:MAG TPA: hypothetical protein VHH36_06905, partial [Candidatus Thermoplasmatota archaeon]|nr:hypothetical protein [Candidatus Thermoplasmatota archaeon]